MHNSARSLASYGRHGDNNLLHVSNSELRGIELLTGKKFTRNPDTGLPEAFNFGKILNVAAPIIAGVGVTAATGNPVLGAAASGAVSGGLAKSQGASTEQALAQGLMSGITSYAGGQMLSGVGAAPGVEAAPAAAAQGASQMAPTLNPMVSNAAYAGAESVGQAAGYQGALGPATGMEGKLASMGEGFTQAGNRISNVISDPGAAASQLGSNIMANKPAALLAGAGLYSTASDLMADQRPNIPGQTPYDPGRYPEAFPAVPRTWNAPPAGYIPGQGPEYRYFAKGGLASMRSSDNAIKNIVDEAKAALLNEHPRPKEALARLEETFGPGSVALLRDRIGGGRVSGAGGGMDDLVPGTIEGRQKVRLADGEFVVPADVVSGLGDGSTDQGVRRLHGMMDKVRKERTGKEAQPKAVGGKITL